MMTNFHLNTTVVAIFPNVCLWRRSLCSDLVLTLKNRIEPPSYARTAYVCCNMALISFRLFRKNLGNLRDFFGQMVYRPPCKKFPVRLCGYYVTVKKKNSYFVNSEGIIFSFMFTRYHLIWMLNMWSSQQSTWSPCLFHWLLNTPHFICLFRKNLKINCPLLM